MTNEEKNPQKALTMKTLVLFIIIGLVVSRCIFVLIFRIVSSYFHWDINFWEAIDHWDCDWYRSIIVNGYQAGPFEDGTANWAFFPLMPLVIRVFVMATRQDSVIVAFVVNTVIFAAGLCMASKYIWISRRNLEPQKRTKLIFLFVFLMIFGIYSFYSSMLYSEALYFCLLACAFYHLERKNYIWMGIFGALLSAARNVGVLFCFVVVVHCIMNYLHDETEPKKVSGFVKQMLRNHRLVLGTCLIPMGLFLYMSYLKDLTGDSLAFVRVQAAWGRELRNPFISVASGLKTLDHARFFMSALAVLCMFLIVHMLKSRRFYEAVWGILNLFIPLCSLLDSTPRYEIGNLVFMLAFCEELFTVKKSWRYLIIIFLCGMECIIFLDWMQGKSYVT